jgi:hypothetical protein
MGLPKQILVILLMGMNSYSEDLPLKLQAGFHVCEEVFSSSLDSSKTPMLALGVGEPRRGMNLEQFSFGISDAINQRVITWKNLKDYNLVTKNGDDFEWVKTAIPEAIEKLIALKPGKKVVVFNLDPIDLSRLNGNSITVFELKLILSNPKYFKATAFFKDKRQMSDDEVKTYFGIKD